MSPDHSPQSESELMKALLTGTKNEVLGLIADWSTQITNSMGWRGIVLDESLESWRRLAVYGLFIGNGIPYPMDMQDFLERAVYGMGLPDERGVDVSRSSFVPLPREEGHRILMVQLPIRTSIGPASLYYSVDQLGQVRSASIYPSADEVDVT